MKKLYYLLWLILLLDLSGCYKDVYVLTGAAANMELHFQEQLKLPLPDFSSPMTEDVFAAVNELTEKVTWYTSNPKDIGSPYTKTGGTLRLRIDGYPKTFRYMGPGTSDELRKLIWNDLKFVNINPETQEIMPAIATHWAFGADGKTVYFKLNENALWSDGVPCTADDFVFAMEAMSSPYIHDEAYNNFAAHHIVTKITDYCVKVQVIDDIVMEKTLLLNSVNFAPRPKHFYPKGITEDWVDDYDQKPEPTTGPYSINLTESIKDQILVFDIVPEWWARIYPYLTNTANPSRLEYHVILKDDAEEKAFYAGNLDLFDVSSSMQWENSEQNNNVLSGYINRYVFNYIPLVGIKGICLNPRYPLFSSKSVRWAMYYAFDIQGMIDTALDGNFLRYHNIGTGQVWNGVNFNDTTIRKPYFDWELTRSTLSATGFRNTDSDGILMDDQGQKVAFELEFYKKNQTQELTYLKQQAKKAGIDITLVYRSQPRDESEDGTFQACVAEFPAAYCPDYYDFFSRASSQTANSKNIWRYWSPEMEELLSQRFFTTDLQQLAILNRKIEKIIDDEALIIPTYISNRKQVAAWRWVCFPGWGNRKNPDIDLSPYGYLWIDKTIKLEIHADMKNNKKLNTHVYNLGERYIKKQ